MNNDTWTKNVNTVTHLVIPMTVCTTVDYLPVWNVRQSTLNITFGRLRPRVRTYNDKLYTSPQLFGQFFNFRILIQLFIYEVKKKTSKF